VPPPSLPPELAGVEGLAEVLVEFGEYRRSEHKAREPMTERAWTLLYNSLKSGAKEHSGLALKYVMSRGWKTFDVDYFPGGSPNWSKIATELGLPLPRRAPIPGIPEPPGGYPPLPFGFKSGNGELSQIYPGYRHPVGGCDRELVATLLWMQGDESSAH